MLEFVKRICNRVYYTTILFFLARRNKAQWQKCLDLQEEGGKMSEMARQFMKFQHTQKKIDSTKERI